MGMLNFNELGQKSKCLGRGPKISLQFCESLREVLEIYLDLNLKCIEKYIFQNPPLTNKNLLNLNVLQIRT